LVLRAAGLIGLSWVGIPAKGRALRKILGLVAVSALLVGCASVLPAGSAGVGVGPASSVPRSAVSSQVAPAGSDARSPGPSTPTSSHASAGTSPDRSAGPSASSTPRPVDTSTLAPPRTPAPVSGAADADAVVALLAKLPVKGRAPKTGYDRALFGPAWTDDVTVDGGHNGCDTRNDILRRDLVDLLIKPGSNGCTVLSGVLHDPYTRKTIDFTRGQATSGAVQIDHVVALSDAWQKGAQGRSKQQRENLANDPLNLQAVDGPTNERKGDGDAATWLPPNKSYRCTYVSRQVQVKARYGLWVTAAEKAAIERVLATCGATIPSDSDVSVPAPSTQAAAVTGATTAQPATPSAVAPPATTKTLLTVATASTGCYPLSSAGNCYRPGQFCAAKHHGVSGIDAFGAAITCEQVGSDWRWERS
jgi:hypothetical protein